MKTVVRLLAGVVFAVAVMPAQARVVSIANDSLTVAYDDVSHTFTAQETGAKGPFLKDGRLEGADQSAKKAFASDPVFGWGRKIVIVQKSGDVASLELYKRLPFVLVRKTLHNASGEASDIRKLVPVTFTLDLGKAAGELRTVGTGGLLAPDKNPGSYLFLSVADPATRRGVVAGWVTQDRGSGVVFSRIESGAVELKAQIDYGHLRIPAGGSATVETLAIGSFGDARIGSELYADAVKRQYNISLRAPNAVYCTWYADGHGGAGDEKSTIELAQFAARELKPYGFGVVQIDDQWQDGPHIDGPTRGFDRCRPNGPYPHGMEPVAAEVNKLGLSLGLWWLPFGANHGDPAWKDRQDWFAKWADGSVLRTRGFGGTCLDLTNPEVKKYLASIATLYRDWGVKYYKMDGLWTGTATEQIYINDGYRDDNMSNVAPFHDPSKTQIEAYRDGLKLLRASAGDDVFFSGCCVCQNMRSFTAIGLVDSMRVGPDFNHDGQGIRSGPIRGSRLYFMNGRIWWNDPDPSIVRARNMGGADPSCSKAVSTEQAHLTTSWVSLSGQFYLSSDWLPVLPAERVDIMKRTMTHHNAVARPVDYFDNFLANTWLVTDARGAVRRDVIGVFNFYGQPLKVDHTCAKLGLEAGKRYHAFDFWAGKPMADFTDGFRDEVPPNSCRVVAVRADEGHPVLVSTSRHVTQGMIDVTNEKWGGKALSATSSLVANDPCELRVAGLNDGGKVWKPVAAEVSASDREAGVSIELLPATEPGWCRAVIRSKQTRAVKWTIRFAKL